MPDTSSPGGARNAPAGDAPPPQGGAELSNAAPGLARLQQLKCSVPIIAMSGGVAGERVAMLRAAELLGAKQTLTKPFTLAELGAALRGVLGKPRGGPD